MHSQINSSAGLTKHAQARSTQRAIPPLIIDWLQRYGTHEYDKHGCRVVWFDKRSRRQLEKAVGHQVVMHLRPLLDAYAVIACTGSIVTVGRRSERVNRH